MRVPIFYFVSLVIVIISLRAARGPCLIFSTAVPPPFSAFPFMFVFALFLLPLIPYHVCSLPASLVFYFFSVQLGWDTVGLLVELRFLPAPFGGDSRYLQD